MNQNLYPHVFQPLTIRGVILKNRLEYAPTVVLKCNADGTVGQDMLDFMAWQAKTGAGWVTVGDTPVTHDKTSHYADCALRCKHAGFRIVMIHCAHQNFLAQWLSPASNVRTDEYGGSPENRRRYPLEVLKAVREAVVMEMPIFNKADLLDQLENLKVKLIGGQRIQAVTDGVETVDITSGEIHFYPADSVVNALGVKTDDRLGKALLEKYGSADVIMAGDCTAKGGTYYRANHEAYYAAMRI